MPRSLRVDNFTFLGEPAHLQVEVQENEEIAAMSDEELMETLMNALCRYAEEDRLLENMDITEN